MRKAEAGWGKYALEICHSREHAEERYRWWEERTRLFPGAEVRVLSWNDPLGGETFVLCTETLELIPEEWRRKQDQAARERIAELRKSGPVEDRDAVELAARLVGMTSSPPPPQAQHTVETLEERLNRIEERLKRLQIDQGKP